MDPEGNYESRLSYTTKSSRDIDIKAAADDPLSEAPEEDRADVATSKRFGNNRLGAWEDDYEEKKRAYDYIGASAPPLSGVPVPAEDSTCSPSPSPLAAEEDTCKRSPVANSDTKCLSPPDEPALNSVVVPIGPSAVDSLPVALPIVTNAVGGGLNATLPLPEVPETAQPPLPQDSPTEGKSPMATRKACSTKKILLVCLVVMLVGGLAATLTILLWPDEVHEGEVEVHDPKEPPISDDDGPNDPKISDDEDGKEEPKITNGGDVVDEPHIPDNIWIEHKDSACEGTVWASWQDKTLLWCKQMCSMNQGCVAYEFSVVNNKCQTFRTYTSTKQKEQTTCGNTEDIDNRSDDDSGCLQDVRECDDGSFVFRDPANECAFRPCPPFQFCAWDILECSDGSFVSRDPYNGCKFEPCAPTNTKERTDQLASCIFNGVTYPEGDVYDALDGCNSCVCAGDGRSVCTNMACPAPEKEEDKDNDDDKDKEDDKDSDPSDWPKMNNRACTFHFGPNGVEGKDYNKWYDVDKGWCAEKCKKQIDKCKAYDFDSDIDRCRVFYTYPRDTKRKNDLTCWKDPNES